jgi:O-antigen ligase
MNRFDLFYRHFLVFVIVAAFFTNISTYTVRYGLIPLAWIGLLAGLSAPLILSKIGKGKIELRPVVLWAVAFLLISIGWYYVAAQDAVAFQEVQTRFVSVIFLILALVAFSGEREQRLARYWIAGAVVLAAALNVYELFNPMTFSTIPGRSSGLYANVNQSGAALVLGLILSYQVIPDRFKFLFVAISAAGVFPTFSRSAMIGWILIAAFFFARAGIKVQFRRIFVGTIVAIVLVYSPLWSDLQQSLEDKGMLSLNVAERIAFFTGGQAQDDSANERKAVVAKGWEMFGQQPVQGWGTGANRDIPGFDVGTHNIYVAMLVDHGVIGFFIVPGLLLATVWGMNRRSFDLAAPWLLFMVMWGFFSHNVLEEHYILLAVALVAQVVWSSRTVTVKSTEQSSAEIASPARTALA